MKRNVLLPLCFFVAFFCSVKILARTNDSELLKLINQRNIQNNVQEGSTICLLDSSVYETTNGVFSKSKVCYNYDEYGYKKSEINFGYKLSDNKYNWEQTSRRDYEVDENGNVLTISYPEGKEVYEYNINNKLVCYIGYTLSIESQSWLESIKQGFFITDSCCIDSTFTWNKDFNCWAKFSKTERRYDKAGNEIAIIYYKADSQNDSYLLLERTDIEYNQDNKPVKEIYSNLSNGSQVIMEVGKREVKYDIKNRILNDTRYRKNPQGGEWCVVSIDNHKYDFEKGIDTISYYVEKTYNSFSGILLLSRKTINYYNGMGLIYKTINYIRDTYFQEINVLLNDNMLEYSYDEYGNLVQTQQFSWNTYSGQWLLKTINSSFYSIKSIQKSATVKNAIKFQKLGHGSVKYNNQFIYTNDVIQINADSCIIINLLPDVGYRVSSVFIEGHDYSDKIENGYVTIPRVFSDAILKVEFKEIMYNLSINQFNNCNLIFLVRYNEIFSPVKIKPDTNWNIESVIFNGIDVTANLVDNTFFFPILENDSELRIIYSQQNANSEISPAASEIKVLSNNMNIFLYNVPNKELIEIYSIDGVLINRVESKENIIEVNMHSSGVYLVKTRKKTYKVIL